MAGWKPTREGGRHCGLDGLDSHHPFTWCVKTKLGYVQQCVDVDEKM